MAPLQPAVRSHTRALVEGLRDARSRRVVLLSHCLLNENVRYLGGAFQPAGVDAVVDAFRAQGTAIHQMPCPERVAWGGALKRRILPFYGSRDRLAYRMSRPFLGAFAAYTRCRYRALARALAGDVADYRGAGVEVAGIVGVRGSPSCAVTQTRDLAQCFEAIAACPRAHPDRARLNDALLGGTLPCGSGMFITALQRRLRTRRLEVPFFEFDLVAEMRGETSPQRLLRAVPQPRAR